MTIANTFAAKLSVAFVAVAMALSMVAPAQAQTAEELQAQIDTLMATIASLQGTEATASASAYVFTRPLTIGSQGADVTALQTYLIAGGYSIPAGATGYFGAQTAAAVAAWQTANGVMPAAGYFGPVSQAKYNALMAATPTPTPDEDEDEDEDEDVDSSDLQGEASLGDVDLQDGDDTDIEEGQEAAPVAEFEVSFEDGDAMIDRLDVELTATGEEDGWDTFDEVSLWVDGDEVASIDTSDEDNWNSDEQTLRFSGLDLVAMEDEDVTITIAVTVAGSVDDLDANWDVDVTEIRYTDADDVTSTDTVAVTATDFDITVEGADDEVIVKSSTEDIDATTLQLEDDSKSDMMTIFTFDIDTDDSTNDIEVDTIVVSVDGTEDGTTGTTTALLIDDAQLVVDGEEYDDVTIVNGTTGTYTFDIDGDLVIEAGDRVSVEFQVEFKALASTLEGATVQATADGSDIVSEGADDITGEGSATGDEHTLRTEGAILEVTEVDETSKANDDGAADDEGVFTIEFDVTAFENDIWVNKTADRGTTMGTLGANYTIEDANGAVIATGTSTESLTSTADTDGTRFLVSEGETETFTLTVEFDPAAEGFFQLQLYSFNFATTNANPTTQQLALPAEDYETGSLSI
jgi:hypothetical protein